jgi:DNA-binding NarL/FixJ family response regulator
MNNRIRLLIADDHPIFRGGLRNFLEVEPDVVVVGEAASGEEALDLTYQLAPDLLLLDLMMPGIPSLEVIRTLAGNAPGTRMLLLTGNIESHELIKALQLGAHGVVMKQSGTETLLKAIRLVMAGQYWIGRERIACLVETMRAQATVRLQAGEAGDLIQPATHPMNTRPIGELPVAVHEAVRSNAGARPFGLTPRELDIVKSVTDGLTNREIARRSSILRPQPSAVCFDDQPGDVETERSTVRIVLVPLCDGRENRCQAGLADAGTAVDDCNQAVAVPPAHAHPDDAAGRGEFDRVVDQVRQHVKDPRRIAVHHHRAADVTRQHDRFGRGE